jgi:hypothetical protein
MASIKAGLYSVDELLKTANFDFEKESAAEYNGGAPDFRRVKVGGLSFDSLDRQVNVPVTADTVTVTLDGKKVAELSVELDDEQKAERKLSLETAANAEE